MTTATTLQRFIGFGDNSTGGRLGPCDVPLERAATLKLGTRVEIVDGAGEVLAPSEVSFVSPRADPATQMVLVKASVDNQAGRLRAAQFVRARIVWRQHDGPVVPVLSVQRRAGQAFVWVVSGTEGALTAALRAVQIGPIEGQRHRRRRLTGLVAGKSRRDAASAGYTNGLTISTPSIR